MKLTLHTPAHQREIHLPDPFSIRVRRLRQQYGMSEETAQSVVELAFGLQPEGGAQ